jgi:hypothetical protein
MEGLGLMSDELFLIAHKVRNEPAFDVAIKMPCPICEAQGCHECDDNGHFWIIPTSGHRAYPWWSEKLSEWDWWTDSSACNALAAMPSNIQDHYPTRATPQQSLADVLGIGRPSPTPTKIHRRF